MDDAECQEKLAALKRLVRMAEKAYDDLYEAHSQHEVNSCYRDAKDYIDDAIALADQLGLANEAEQLRARRQHIKGVYRSQFAG